MAMRIGNWKTDSVFRRYRIITRRDLQRAAAKMNDFFQQEEEQIKKEVTKVVTKVSVRSLHRTILLARV